MRRDTDVTRQRHAETRPWMLVAFPAAIVVPILAGLFLGGPAVGFLVAALVAGVIVVAAIRMEPRRKAAAERTEDHAWRRSAARRFVVPIVIAAAGIVVIAVASSDATRAIGGGVLAIAVTIAVSLVFLEIGYSEDRARARERRR